jgi:predicted N-acetyltransferase YhbS
MTELDRSFVIRPLTPSDVTAADELRRLAGWNQTEADWLRLISYEPRGCFAAEWDGALVATVTTTTYGSALAWIGMMLVHPDFRRRGIASALMRQAMATLEEQGIACIKLDATPAGAPVYQRLGFVPECGLHRWEFEAPNGAAGNCGGAEPAVCSRSENVDEFLLQLDADAFGVDRSSWLRELAADAFVEAEQDGYGLLRRGSRADALGPVVAATAGAAREIITRLLNRGTGAGYWDIPDDNAAAVDLANSLGGRRVRPFVRMWTGRALVAGNLALQYAIGDPATG